MTISNRRAGEDGKLGVDVLALAGAEKAPVDTGEELGWNPAPGLVSALLGARGVAAEFEARASVDGQAADSKLRQLIKQHALAAGEHPERIEDAPRELHRACPSREVVSIDEAASGPGSDYTVATVRATGQCVTREDLARCVTRSWTPEEQARIDDVIASANAEVDAEMARRYGGNAKALADEKIANPLRVMTLAEDDKLRRRASWEEVRRAIDAGLVTLPPNVELQLLEPKWPNPEHVEARQVWELHRAGFASAPLVVRDVDSDSALLDGHGSAVLTDVMLDSASGWRCVGYELPDGNRIMVGEYRQGDAGDGSSIWRVSQILDGARVRITSPVESSSPAEHHDVPVMAFARWSVVATNDAAWRALREESIANAATMGFEVRETPAGFWRALAEQFALRRFAHEDSDGQVPLVPASSETTASFRDLVADLRAALASPDGGDLVVPRTVSSPGIFASSSEASRYREIRFVEDTSILDEIRRRVSSRGDPAKLTSLHKDPAADYAYRWVVDPPPAEYQVAPGQVGYLLTRCMADTASGPTMRAEAASSDVSPAAQDRSASPPSADCGPSFVRPITKAAQAMIDAGFTVDPSLL